MGMDNIIGANAWIKRDSKADKIWLCVHIDEYSEQTAVEANFKVTVNRRILERLQKSIIEVLKED